MPSSDELRRFVTVVTSDLKGSTALGETLDPESLREVLTRYFDEMRIVFESHGGTIEKIIGDAIIAVFGLPARADDDALRAVEAAAVSVSHTGVAARDDLRHVGGASTHRSRSGRPPCRLAVGRGQVRGTGRIG